ncbi:hypothetical protein [Roseovarius aestuarii]|uniref:Uncharacterized protein n=1 Tax=Roseovarius aestuarii TaxID=475083 RepID=A0A1X7BQF7_9RHOB|nr:hypothetical protein [Roseovarius aestuarii]SMC11825.1 hypothetical protein ROA7745_01644 [Roseovarius aestuarii]
MLPRIHIVLDWPFYLALAGRTIQKHQKKAANRISGVFTSFAFPYSRSCYYEMSHSVMKTSDEYIAKLAES